MKKKKIYFIVGIIIIIIILLVITGTYKCPLSFVFGIPCPLCGMTRAFQSLLELNFEKAFYYHALWPVIIIGIVISIMSDLKLINLSKRQKNIIVSLYIFIIVSYYIVRHIVGSEVVKIELSKSLIYKIIKLFS